MGPGVDDCGGDTKSSGSGTNTGSGTDAGSGVNAGSGVDPGVEESVDENGSDWGDVSGASCLRRSSSTAGE